MNQEGVLFWNYFEKRAYARTPLQKGYGRPDGLLQRKLSISTLWGTLLLGVPEWLCTWAILGAKVTPSKSIVFPAKDRPAGRPLFVREFWRNRFFAREFWRTHFFESGTPSWFIVFLWVFCTYTREWRWRRSRRRYHWWRILGITNVISKIVF